VSITEWNVVSGALPPLTQAQWQAEFDAYRQTPQYILVNGPAGMTLATTSSSSSGNGSIACWRAPSAWRCRAAGVVLALRGQIPAGYKPRLLALLALGALQGAVGWWMVKSGIVHDVKVSHYRLATHLAVALFTPGGIVWTMLDLRALARGEGARG
jgi:cytochrome c oxidase assembly protein subunit 15